MARTQTTCRAAALLTVCLASWTGAQQPAAIDLGVQAFNHGDLAEAVAQFRRAVQQHPADPRALRLLGTAYAAQEQFLKAREPLERACKLDPREEYACFYLGRVLYHLGDFRGALRAYQIALQHQPRSDAVQRGIALTLEALGRFAEAERYFREAARGANRYAVADYARFLFRQGRLEESRALFLRAGAAGELAQLDRVRAATPSSKAIGSAGQVRFDIRELPMTVRNSAQGEKHQIETMIAGVAVFDYDNDGWPDVYITNGADLRSLEKADPSFFNRLFHNNHDGTLTDVTKKAGVAGRGYSMGVAVGDYDNDGWADLFVTGVRQNVLYHNRGDGTFEDATQRAGLGGSGRWAVAAGWFDYDNDGFLDLFVVNYVVWDPATEPFCGDERPGYRGYCHPDHYQPLPNELYRNLGGGVFRDVSRESGIAEHAGKGMGVVFGDYDADGRLDVFVGNDTVPNFLFHNLGDGRFDEVAVKAGVAYSADGRTASSMGADFRDLDNDGREDLFVTALSNEGFSLFRNLGAGAFVDVSYPTRLSALSLSLSGWSAGAFDLDNDGFKDLFSASGFPGENAELSMTVESRQSNVVFLNRGGASFGATALPQKALFRGAAFGDLNRDGRVDAVVTRLNETPLVLTNTTHPEQHWLGVRLRGARSTRDGIGAMVHIETASGSQWNRATTSTGYGGSSDVTVHFGLGRDAEADVEVLWPSGVRQKLHQVPAGQIVEIHEPT